MEVNSATYYGWRNNFRTIENRNTYHYEEGNSVTIVEKRSYQVHTYDNQGSIVDTFAKGKYIDVLA